MSTEKQATANRENATHSTGPRTEAGKATSRLNGLKHGLTGLMRLMPDEDQPDYARHSEGIVANLRPESELELRLAQSIADDYWRIDRIRRIEQTLFLLAAPDEFQVTIDYQKQLNLYTLYESRLNRNVRNNLAELRKIQDNRRLQEDEDAAIQDTQTKAAAAGIMPKANGFGFPYRSIPEMIEAERQSLGPCEPINISDLTHPQRKKRS